MSSLREELTPPSAWQILALLTSLNVVNFIDRQLITSLQIPLRDDPQLQLTDLQIQLLAGYAFSIVYSMAGLYLGALADRTHRPRLIALGLFVWSGATFASGFAQNFSQLAFARIFVAFGESTLTPAGIAMLADVFRPRQRSLAFGLYYLGIPIGASLCLIIANLLWPIPWVGWRGCFIGLGGIGLVMVGFLLLVKDPRRGGTETHASTVSHSLPEQRRSMIELCGEIWRIMRKAPSLPMTMLGGICINISVGAAWLDSFWLHAERGFSKQGAPIFLGILFLFGGCFGNIFGGWLGDFFNRYRSGGRLLAVVASQLVIAPFAIAFRFLPGDSYFLLALCGLLSFILVTIWYGPVLATVQELSPVRLRATTVAILLIGLNILGASLGAVIATVLSGALKSYTWGIFLAAQASLIAIPLFILAYRRYETDLARVTSIPGETG
jgi:MFS transporter, Spinster family, sphingosine-1-phosphate transporter